ncbi:MAG: tRNA (adenosine(37)-N6)-dimethylallyltransferase MiaA [Bacteroidetes bacterium]|nr:tRNA (adenosine(37)-N6)-dimethylallyltransferase MiaA [Bacteroidota bacterium]
MEKTLLVITGATASGKTRLAIEWAQHYQTEIISADSRQFYKGMDIGTAKPDSEELAAIKHHFIDTREPWDYYSAGDFEKDALLTLNEIFQKKDIAIAVGGSGLYLKALCEGLDIMPPADLELRKSLQINYEKFGLQWLQSQYLNVTQNQTQLDLKNPQRLMRAIEKLKQGLSIQNEKKIRPFRILKYAIAMEREVLYQRINKRVDIMVEHGLEAEARILLPFRESNALKTVGYSEMFEYFDGLISRERAIELIKQHSRNYAKRQLTWFKADPEITWIRANEVGELKNILPEIS